MILGQPRSQSSSVISDVTSPVKLVGNNRARFQASSGHSDSASRPGYEADIGQGRWPGYQMENRCLGGLRAFVMRCKMADR